MLRVLGIQTTATKWETARSVDPSEDPMNAKECGVTKSELVNLFRAELRGDDRVRTVREHCDRPIAC